jgi:hypothetical protein
MSFVMPSKEVLILSGAPAGRVVEGRALLQHL